MKIKLDLKIFLFIFLFILTKQIQIYVILMIFAFIHEIGHIIVGLILKFKINELKLMPYGLCVEFKTHNYDYNEKIKNGNSLAIKRLLIALGGPVTNIIIAVIYTIFPIKFFGVDNQYIVYSNILICIFNLLPIYPLDGGRIIKNILHIFLGIQKSYEYTNKISNIIMCILTAISSILILYLKNMALIVILAYLWYLIIRENKIYKNKKILYKNINKINIRDK